MLFNWYVKPLSCYVSKVLPATYDATLSYYECLAKLTYKLNETIKNLNDLEENLPTYVQQAIDAALGGWEEKMQQQFAEQNAKLQAMQEQIDAQDEHIDQKLETGHRGCTFHIYMVIGFVASHVLHQLSHLAEAGQLVVGVILSYRFISQLDVELHTVLELRHIVDPCSYVQILSHRRRSL